MSSAELRRVEALVVAGDVEALWKALEKPLGVAQSVARRAVLDGLDQLDDDVLGNHFSRTPKHNGAVQLHLDVARKLIFGGRRALGVELAALAIADEQAGEGYRAALVRLLVEADAIDQARLRALVLAGGDGVLLAEAIRTLKDDAGEALVRAGLSNALPAARSAALQQVVAVGLEDAFDVVVAALKDPAGDVRSAALFALVAIGDARALPLMEPLLDDPDPYNRANPYPVSYTAEVCIAKLKKKLSG